ncbi:hypothetical protein [Methanonatronarchaeum sp. AMET6-2]|uniref:hypothetical protein n=1 Tax=Methanonatronarchaeum sp. AMET6-2 TaxID=2933293 RepID=UPI0011F44DB9|nr:hypothetical protein [Methanonatronarchaeum sp. AMET6-2]RZN62262.1 MAG: hypothetical protein EF811_03410 [Methanonatronarchaeia archaeon]UOY10400.1 hypothetical protein MU439_01855 [Methanonatronarchaeum sp. AMET6-2]
MNRKTLILSIFILSIALATAGCIGGYDKTVQAEEGLADLTSPDVPAEIQNHIDLEQVGLEVSDDNLVITIETYGDIPSFLESGESTYEVSIVDLDDDMVSETTVSLSLIGDEWYPYAEKPVDDGVEEFEVDYDVDSKFFGGHEVTFEVPLDEIGDPSEIGIQVTSMWEGTDFEDGYAMDFVPIEDGEMEGYIEFEV